MRIELNYFSGNQQRREETLSERPMPQSFNIPAKDSAEETRIQKAVDKAMETLEQNRQKIKDEVAKDRTARFFDMANKIVPVAKWMWMDLLIEAHKTDMGKIQMVTNRITIDEHCPEEIRNAFFEVLSTADEILVNRSRKGVEITLYFQRFDVVMGG